MHKYTCPTVFEKCRSGHTISFQGSNYQAQETEWFDDICTQKRNIYLEALRDFNCVKNDEDRRKLWERKCDYKYFCAKRKRQYCNSRQLYLQMNEMRKTKPRYLWKQFKRKNNINTGNIKLSEFYEHFKTIASEVKDVSHGEADDFLRNFDETQHNTPTFP